MSIEVKNLNFSYGNRQVLHDISFTVGSGEFLSILGPNGVGKSTRSAVFWDCFPAIPAQCA